MDSEERAGMTVEELMKRYAVKKSGELDNDEMLFG